MSRRLRTLVFVSALFAAGAPAHGQLQPEWITRLPVDANIGVNGLYGFELTAGGVSYITGTGGPSWDSDVVTAAIAADGSVLWSHSFDGTEHWGDQARGLALGGDGHLYVTGNTPGPGSYANLLVLEYDPATGALLDSVQLAAGPSVSEHGAAIAADAAGNVYVGGGTTGDGGDALLLSLDAAGALRWRVTWDGPADSPYSNDTLLELAVDPNGDLIVMIHGVMASLQPDYVIQKYSPGGALLWATEWGGDGGDYAADLDLDAGGDVFVTGTSVDEFATIRLRGSDGGLLWERFDSYLHRNSAYRVTLDGRDAVYVTGRIDPDVDASNSNDDVYTVKRDALSGDLLWTHSYGAPCLYCYDAPGDLAVDPAGNVFLGIGTGSPPYGGDALLLVLDEATAAERNRGVVTGGTGEIVYPGRLRFDAAWNLHDGGAVVNYDNGQIAMSVTRWPALVEPLFADGFEDGTTAAWSQVFP